MMKKIVWGLILCMLTAMLPSFGSVSAAGVTVLYVAPNGSDSAAGTESAPLQTLNGARTKVRSLISGGKLGDGITVIFKEGEYPISSTVYFYSSDSGKAGAPVTYRAEEGANVVFTGAQTLPRSCISPVTEEDTDAYGTKILDRVLSPQAQEKLMKIDLSAYTGTLKALPDRGWNIGNTLVPNVYVDEQLLEESRWPNEEEDHGMLRSQPGTSGKTIVYPDPEGRTELWDPHAYSDVFINGMSSEYWYCHDYRLGSIDPVNRRCTVKGNVYSGFVPDYPIYFSNLLEEIDMPGESYIDRTRKIAYFYPSAEIREDSVVRVNKYSGTMLSVSGASYLNFEHLNFMYDVSTPISVSSAKYVTFDGCTAAHTSYRSASFGGTNVTVKNCHFYDTAYGGITISGGNRTSLTPADIVVENCILHDNDRMNHCYCPSISVSSGVGITLRHNLIYNGHHEIVAFGSTSNDITVEQNEIHHAVTEAGDMGAIYWGRNPSALGIVIRNNYFHHNGNPYNLGFNQSIFGDDGNTGAYIYGNVFYQGTLTEERGGTTKKSYAAKTNGGQFYNVCNNVFIDSPTATNFSEWIGSGFSSPQQGKYIAYNYDLSITDSTVTEDHSEGQWNKIKNFLGNSTWKEHYRGTQWEVFFDVFTTERYNTLQSYAKSHDRAGAINYIKTFVPSKTNTFARNVNLKIANPSIVEGKNNAVLSENYTDSDLKLPSGNSYFRDFENGDLTLTSEALSKIRETVPSFEDVGFSEMGLTSEVDGFAPSVSDAAITLRDGRYYTDYTFSDRDGDREGFSKIVWYACDRENGEYERLYGFGDREIFFDDPAMIGRFLKAEITPLDTRARYGKTVTTAPVQITELCQPDRSKLEAALSRAKTLADGSAIGDGAWQYPKEAYAAFEAVIGQAQRDLASPALTGDLVSRDTILLNRAVEEFRASGILPRQPLPTISVSRSGKSAIIRSDRSCTVCVVFASYRDGEMTAMDSETVSLFSGTKTVTPTDFTPDGTVKIMVFSSLRELMPLCVCAQ